DRDGGDLMIEKRLIELQIADAVAHRGLDATTHQTGPMPDVQLEGVQVGAEADGCEVIEIETLHLIRPAKIREGGGQRTCHAELIEVRITDCALFVPVMETEEATLNH